MGSRPPVLPRERAALRAHGKATRVAVSPGPQGAGVGRGSASASLGPPVTKPVLPHRDFAMNLSSLRERTLLGSEAEVLLTVGFFSLNDA